MKTHVHIQETDENEEKTLQKTLNTTNTRKHNIRRLKLLEWEKKRGEKNGGKLNMIKKGKWS